MNKQDINLLQEAYTKSTQPGLINEMESDSFDLDASEYEGSWLETHAENALTKFLTLVDFDSTASKGEDTSFNPFKGQSSVPMRKLPKALKLKVMNTWMQKLREYARMDKTESSPAREYEV